MLHGFCKVRFCRSEGACFSRPKSLLAVVETLRFAQGDIPGFYQATLQKTGGYDSKGRIENPRYNPKHELQTSA